MNNLLNQLVGLCAGREALLRLERRQLLEKFKRLPENPEDKVNAYHIAKFAWTLSVHRPILVQTSSDEAS